MSKLLNFCQISVVYASFYQKHKINSNPNCLLFFFSWEKYLFIDFAVGAYKSDEVVLLRARPIVEVRVYSRIDPDPVPLTSTGTPCGSQGSQGSTNPCFTASLCFDFTGEGTNKTCMYYREIFFWTKKWVIFNLTSFKKSQMRYLNNSIRKHFIESLRIIVFII